MKKAIRLPCTAASEALNSVAIEGSAGRYMSMAKGPTAANRPSTIAFRARLRFIAWDFREVAATLRNRANYRIRLARPMTSGNIASRRAGLPTIGARSARAPITNAEVDPRQHSDPRCRANRLRSRCQSPARTPMSRSRWLSRWSSCRRMPPAHDAPPSAHERPAIALIRLALFRAGHRPCGLGAASLQNTPSAALAHDRFLPVGRAPRRR